MRGRSSPDDPGLRDYWWARRKTNFRFLSDSDVRLAERQDWRCPVCGMDLNNGEELHRHHKQPRCLGGSDASVNREIVHLYCHQQRHAMLRQGRKGADGDERSGPWLCASDLLEPYEGQLSSTVLRGGGGRDAAPLPDTLQGEMLQAEDQAALGDQPKSAEFHDCATRLLNFPESTRHGNVALVGH